MKKITPSDRYLYLLKRNLTDLYDKKLGLDNLENRIQKRVERVRGKRTISFLDEKIGVKGKKILDVGSGWGEIIACALEKGADAYGIDIDLETIEIANELVGETRSICAKGEHIPCPDNSFDIVTSYCVLEHVENYKLVIKELLRITKAGGIIYLLYANYLSHHEGHYKIKNFPPLCPKWLGTLILKLKGRDPYFWQDSVNPVHYFQVKKILMHLPVVVTDVTKLKLMGDNTSGNSLKHLFDKLRVVIRRPFYPVDEFLLRKYEMD